MGIEKTPFQVHLLVCQNTRPDQPDRPSCGGAVSAKISEDLKMFVDENKLKAKVRISTAKCLGPCPKGPNVMMYPQEIWYSGCSSSSSEDIKKKILEIIAENSKA